MGIRKITTKAELVALAERLGVRQDWHEPDNQGVAAVVAGEAFDNAGFWPVTPTSGGHGQEMCVFITVNKGLFDRPVPVAVVNLATLFAWATNFPD